MDKWNKAQKNANICYIIYFAYSSYIFVAGTNSILYILTLFPPWYFDLVFALHSFRWENAKHLKLGLDTQQGMPFKQI